MVNTLGVFTWRIHLAYSLGFHLVRVPCARPLSRAPALGARARSRAVGACSCSRRGLFTWRIHLAYSLGACAVRQHSRARPHYPSFATNLYKLAFSGLGSGGDHLACRNVFTEIRCLDFVEGDATKLAWRMDMAEIRCLDSVEVDATKLAWRIDVAEIRCSDSVEVDAWNFAWRFGVAENSKLGFRSLDSMEADATKPRIDGRMLPKIW